MDFNLNNYKQENIEFYASSNANFLNIIHNSINLDFLQVINILKTNEMLSPASNYKVNVIFENFTTFRDLIYNTKKRINNFLYNFKLTSNQYPESSWSIDFKNSIHITNNLYSNKTSFTEYMNKNLTANEVLNYTFLHELGHSIHSELKKNSKLNFSSNSVIQPNIQKFLNDSIPFTDLNSLNINSNNSRIIEELSKDLSLISYYGMKEGFADLYACIAVSLIYPKQQALNIIQTAIDARNYTDIWTKEFYHSKESINQFLTDFQNNNIRLNNFTDVQNYIEKTIANTIITKLIEQINNVSDNDIFINHYFGVLKNKLKPSNSNSLLDMINYVNSNYDLSFNCRNQNEYFNLGFNHSNLSSPNPQISKINLEDIQKISLNISSLRKQFSSFTPKEPSSTAKNKI